MSNSKTDFEFNKNSKNICGKRGQKGQNVKQKQNKKKETRHGKVFQAGRMQKKKWE